MPHAQQDQDPEAECYENRFLLESPDIEDPGNDMVDITELVRECASQLTLAEPFLCDPESFTLHDAMAASQLADPKMDCCEIPLSFVNPQLSKKDENERRVFPRPAPVGLDGVFTPLPWNDLTPTQALHIGLEAIVRLQSLLSGASVGESTFTCLYAHAAVLRDMNERLFPLEQQIDNLLATEKKHQGTDAQFWVYCFSLALVETTMVVREIVQNADVYEEEDFVAQTHQLEFFTNKHAGLQQLLKDGLALLPEASSNEGSQLEFRGLRALLSFVLGFSLIISPLAKLQAHSLKKDLAEISQLVEETVTDVRLLESLLNEVTAQREDTSVQTVVHQSFDSYVNRPLVGNAPVRKVFFLNLKDSISSIRSTTQELGWSVCQILAQGNSLTRVQRMLDRVSSVNILSRSLLILNLYFEDRILGQFPIVQWLWDDLEQWTSIDQSLLTASRVFLNRLAKPIYDTLKLRTLNANRQRTYIEVVMFPEWIVLQQEAQMLDLHLRGESKLPPYFTQYVSTIMVRLMERYVTTGIEVGLFCSTEEVHYAFWYRDFLLSTLMTTLTSMKRGKLEATKQGSATKNTGKRNKKKNNKQKQQQNAAETASKAQDAEDDLELSVLGLKRNLCRGLIRFIAALRQANVLKANKYAFTSPERTFNERFRAFDAIQQPPALTYEHFAEGSDFSSVSAEDLLRTTVDWFHSCKRTVEQILASNAVRPEYAAVQKEELKSLLKVCIGNSVYLQKLRQLTTDNSNSAKVEFDFSTHSQFCIVKIS